MVRALFLTLFGLTLSGCLLSSPTGRSADVQSTNGKSALPISGKWTATGLWGFTQDENGRVSKIYASREKLTHDSWKVEFNLNSEGDGYLFGRSLCKTEAQKIEGSGKNLSGNRLLLTSNGVLGGLYLLSTVVEMGRCVSSKDGFMEAIMPVSRASHFFGQPVARIDRNLGFVGEGVSSSAADQECHSLRGVRFVSMNKSVSCVGFRDSKANQLRFIVVPAGTIYAVRIDFERD